ncbi:MAG: hypothetical protein DDT34_01948 [Firmicutes bacterium]|nr:hypothetical protein [Bacillota bacterium]
MNDWYKVMSWEIWRNITNKTFLLSMLVTPLLMVLFGALPSLLALVEAERLQTVYMIDGIGIYDEVTPLLPDNIALVRFVGDRGDLTALVTREADTSFVVLDEATLQTGRISIYTAQEGIPELGGLNVAINAALRSRRFLEQGLDLQTAQRLTAELQFPIVSVRPEAVNPLARTIPAAFAGLILISISITGSSTFQSAIQEKKDKMAELLLSSTSPYAIMQGKVLGYFVLGLMQAALWLLVAIPVAILQFDVPVFDFLFVPVLPVMLFFTIVGNLMFSALFASLGATIEDIQEAGNFQGMIMMLPWVPFFFLGSVIANPNGPIALITSYFPLTSPGVMTIRLAMLARIPILDVLVSGLLLLVFTWLIIKLSGKIFKTGMLMYGKNASLGEIIKWVRH